MKWYGCLLIVVLMVLGVPCSVLAENESGARKTDDTHEFTMTAVQAMQLAGAMVERGDIENAEQILTKTPPMNNAALEIERWFLLAQIATRRGDIDSAIEIYRTILDAQPDLARIRFELAVCYMHQKKWSRADYHLRLAMAGDDLPENVRGLMNYYRYIIRQNKNWNVWFNFSAAPDNNINNAVGGQECVYGVFCRDLPDPISAMGYNLTLGGNYEFKLSDQWRWKSDASVYSNIYDLHDYDDLLLYVSTGPRFIWSRGDVWLGALATRRWYGWRGYNWAAGVRINAGYDFTRKLSGGLSLQYVANQYDDYGDFLNGGTYSTNIHMVYSITPSIYTVMRGGIAREKTIASEYSYLMPNISIGIGAELPYGFGVYFEPNFYWQLYDAPQWVVYDNVFAQITEHDFTQRYSISISNNKLDVWGFVPTVVFSYTRRDSNMWQREYDRWAIEFTMQQRF